jgi:hypothetical protein
MTTDISRIVADAYRWQRRLGNTVIAAQHCHIVANPARPEVWDCNHADDVTAETDMAIDAVFAAMDLHLHHTPWRVIHTDGSTSDAFLAPCIGGIRGASGHDPDGAARRAHRAWA